MSQKLGSSVFQNPYARTQHLNHRNFSHGNLRGVNFHGINLTGANFERSVTSSPKIWTIWIGTTDLILSISSGLALGYTTGSIIDNLLEFQTAQVYPIIGTVALFVLLSFLAIIVCYGVRKEWGFAAIATAMLVPIVSALGQPEVVGSATVIPIYIAGGTAGVVVVSIGMAVATIIGDTWLVALISTAAGLGAILGNLFGFDMDTSEALAFNVASLTAAILVGLGIHISRSALAGNLKYTLIRDAAVAIAAIGGVSFRNANLTDADFSHATLKCADFRGANLTRTCWRGAKQLEYARLGDTYPANPRIRQLLITGDGRDQTYEGLRLRGVNLEAAHLTDTNFRGANLIDANLRGADLTGAILVKARLDGADLTGAILTGAYIQDWSITTDTILEGVQCEYIYMRLPTKANPDPHRKPDNRNEIFQTGDFADFIKPLVDTLDLYHNRDIDPRAIAFSFKTLAESNPDAQLEIVAMEKRSTDKFLLRAKTAPSSDRSQLSAEYFRTYDRTKHLSDREWQAISTEKDKRIERLETMVMTALQRPSFYAETYYHEGDTTMSESQGNINISAGEGSKLSGIVAAGESMTNTGAALGEISGTVTIALNQLPDAPTPDQPGIKELLTQLKEAIENESNLDDAEKTEALEQLQKLAEAGQNPQEGTMQKLAKKAIGFLQVIINTLPGAAQLVEVGQLLLPRIANLFGL